MNNWRNVLRTSQCLQAHNCCYAQRPVVERMVLSHIRRNTCDSWSTCAPHWFCVAAPCRVEAAGIQEATLKQATGSTCCNSHNAFKRSTVVSPKGPVVECMADARSVLPVVAGNLCASLALRHSTLQCGSCWHMKSNSEAEQRAQRAVNLAMPSSAQLLLCTGDQWWGE